MIRIPILAGILVLGTVGHATPDDRVAPLTANANDQGIEVREGKQPVLFYQRTPKSQDGKFQRAHYVHPLYDLDGNVLTEDFPADHPHHRGIFWAWHQVWLGDRKLGDPWLASDFSWQVYTVETTLPNPDLLQLRCFVTWTSPQAVDALGARLALVRETTTIRIHRAGSGHRNIDFRIELQALQAKMRIGGSEDAKGYGGFSPRIRLPEGIRFRGETGLVEPQRTAVQGGAWMDIVGHFSEQSDPSGLAILCHPDNPGFPQGWILRSSGSMQNAAYPGQHPVPLSLKSPLVLSYRLVLHRGEPEPSVLARWHQDFTSPSAASP